VRKPGFQKKEQKMKEDMVKGFDFLAEVWGELTDGIRLLRDKCTEKIGS
jgi:hypothetical protein